MGISLRSQKIGNPCSSLSQVRKDGGLARVVALEVERELTGLVIDWTVLVAVLCTQEVKDEAQAGV